MTSSSEIEFLPVDRAAADQMVLAKIIRIEVSFSRLRRVRPDPACTSTPAWSRRRQPVFMGSGLTEAPPKSSAATCSARRVADGFREHRAYLSFLRLCTIRRRRPRLLGDQKSLGLVRVPSRQNIDDSMFRDGEPEQAAHRRTS